MLIVSSCTLSSETSGVCEDLSQTAVCFRHRCLGKAATVEVAALRFRSSVGVDLLQISGYSGWVQVGTLQTNLVVVDIEVGAVYFD
jgi:hypothetical protein